MPNITVHVGGTVFYGPLTIYKHFDALNPILNELDTTSPITVDIQTGGTGSGAVVPSLQPTTDGTPSRTVRVDGVATFVGTASVRVFYLGQVIGSLSVVVAANTAPAHLGLEAASAATEVPTASLPPPTV